MSFKKLIFTFCFLGIACCVQAQFSSDTTVYDWNPSVVGSGPVRGYEASYHGMTGFDVGSKSEIYGDGKGKVDYNRIFKTKLRFPISVKKNLKIAGSIEYSDEEIHFHDSKNITYPFYRRLHDKNMKSLGGSFYLMTQWKRNRYFMLRFNGKLKGDYWKDHIGDVSKYTFLKMEISPVMGWKINKYKSWGVGVAFSYTFGDPLVFPTFVYNHTFADKWGVEAFLPAKVKLRYQPSELCFINAKAYLKGGSYSIHFDEVPADGDASADNPSLSDFKTLEFRRSDVNFSLEIEKGITDWLWLSFEGGYRSNINFDVTNKNNALSLSGSKLTSEDNIIDSYAKGGMFYNLTLFIVPSKSLLKKIGFK
ncbi:DUF6268 family outer membrane beta-barrel protein [Marinifilum caeruleilacunae]|uniref:DUF6268 domain-containing protein n=1 Tax=Marinifilum caeruleilacunae TaxID=2499076 RepID=A0ABX1WVE1_9BACT|nr:DUF6268 family outer membrane beta-barrel protein [Marinifilum caeruleilacunae]NOU59976.1 hypothetical protein [Marinifilum caeruleilacunae]